jgi:multicomponent K+:H+ antiporter subunit D
MTWTSPLLVAPVALPLLAGTLMLFVDDRRRAIRSAINAVTVAGNLAVCGTLLLAADSASKPLPYALGSWPAPFGIVLVLDRLSALMLLLTAVLAAATFPFSLARGHRVGVYFHP